MQRNVFILQLLCLSFDVSKKSGNVKQKRRVCPMHPRAVLPRIIGCQRAKSDEAYFPDDMALKRRFAPLGYTS